MDVTDRQTDRLTDRLTDNKGEFVFRLSSIRISPWKMSIFNRRHSIYNIIVVYVIQTQNYI